MNMRRAPSQGLTGALPSSIARYARVTRAELESIQFERMRALVERAWQTMPYYKARMTEARVSPGDIRTLADFFTRFPFSDKAAFLADQAANPPFGSRLGVARKSVALISMTSGTSGQGQEMYGRTQRDIHQQGYLHALPYVMAGLRPGHVALNCVPAGGLTTGGWGPGEGFRMAGATALHAGGVLNTEAKIDLLLRMGELNFIYASTNYMHRLTEALMGRGIVPREAFPRMAGILIAAEGYPAAWALKVQDLWGCTVHEGYGSTQCAGFSASTCGTAAVTPEGERARMYFYEWETLAEVLDPATGKPVGEGEEGELVVTNLNIEGSPVLRFRTGDRVRAFPAGAPGSVLPWLSIEAGGIGRYDDMLKIRGNNVWPSAVDVVCFSFPEVLEYAGRVYTDGQGRTQAEIRCALNESACADQNAVENLLCRLRDSLKARTNVTMELVVVPRAELPEYLYKARRWKDERKEGYRL